MIGHSPRARGSSTPRRSARPGLTAALGIAERVSALLVAELGVELGAEAPLPAGPPPPGLGADGPWWRAPRATRSAGA